MPETVSACENMNSKVQTGSASMGSNMKISQKNKTEQSYGPTIPKQDICPKKKNMYSKRYLHYFLSGSITVSQCIHRKILLNYHRKYWYSFSNMEL